MRPKGIFLRYAPQDVVGAHQQSASSMQSSGNNEASSVMKDGTKISSQEDKNLMPSMVVRQQRNQSNYNSSNNNNEYEFQIKTKASSSIAATAVITTDQLFEEAKKRAQRPQQPQRQHSFDQNGLILPKRVLPYQAGGAQDGQPQAAVAIRDLNRELKFNQVRGKNVLDQKSELKKALEKLEANKRQKEAEQERLTRRTSLELRLEERAQRLASKDEASEGKEQQDNVLSI